ncbi:GNAT family N-acetyltransferase [Patescibacteria group bacterium]|nr:GNAT family N-acetyltransferase [Patescibacteria group bacterium]
MVKITKLKEEEAGIFRKLLLKIFIESFSYYPLRAQKFNKRYWSVGRLTQYSHKKIILLLLAREASLPVGLLIGKYYSSGKSSILWLGVLITHRGKGIGAKLVKHWEEWAKAKGVHTFRTSTADFQNEKFYSKLGFTKSPGFEMDDWGMKKMVFIKKEYHG